MADSVTTQILQKTDRRAVILFTNVSDGTGESAVQKVDISAVFPNATRVKINKVKYTVLGMSVQVFFDHTVDDRVLVLAFDGHMDFTSDQYGCSDVGGLADPNSAGGSGDILFTTLGHTIGDSYTIILDISPA